MDAKDLDRSEFSLEWFSCYRRIIEAFMHKIPFQEALVEAFQLILWKVAYLLGRNQGLHIFVNPNKGLGEFKQGIIDYMLLDRKQYSQFHIREEQPRNLFGLDMLDDDFWARAQDYYHTTDYIVECADLPKGEFWRNLEAKYEIKLDSDLCFVRLSGELSGESYNLGLCFFWNSNSKEPFCGPETETDLLKVYIQDLQKLLIENMIGIAGIEPKTYLPSYRKTGKNTVAIMFCDIRNFTTLMEILRSKGKFENVTKLVNSYCERMGQVIKRYGRLDKFMGDGVMALFGEYTEDKKAICGRALLCAKEMMDEFDKCMGKWLSDKRNGIDLESFRQTHNEHVDIRLGVGLDLGEVHFDYYGISGMKAYSAIGDHVNFAQRLESNAAKVINLDTGITRPPLLLSQAFFSNCVDGNGGSFFNKTSWNESDRNRPDLLPIKGLGYRFPVYMIQGSDINEFAIRSYLDKSGGW